MSGISGKVISAAADIKAETLASYSAIRARIPLGTPITVLHIGGDLSGVAGGHEFEPEAMLLLNIGTRKTANDYFKHVPPTPGELEMAIVAVEDEVSRTRTISPDNSTLFTNDSVISQIGYIAGIPEGVYLTLTLHAVEQTFARLVAVTLGRPALQEGIPARADFAAALLILREFMHHMEFSAITVMT